MKTALIVSEYNPFHNGHHYQINYIRKNYKIDNVISLLSGNFVQRGEPSILDKFTKSSMAINGGVNLCIELPTIYATSSAEFFSSGACSIANNLGKVDYLSFGVETLDKDLLIEVATILNKENEEFKNLIYLYLKEGNNYPKSRNLAINKITNGKSSSIMDTPNNILGIEYVRALLKLNSKIDIIPIKREGLGYHDLLDDYKDNYFDIRNINDNLDIDTNSAYNNENLMDMENNINPSATALRKILYEQTDLINISTLSNHMPQDVFDTLIKNKERILSTNYIDTLTNLLYYKLLINGEKLFNIPESSDGLGNRILNNIEYLKKLKYEDFIRHINTRRFTNSRIKRLLLHFLLGFEDLNYEEDRKSVATEVRLLSMDNIGIEYLKSIKKTTNIELRHNMSKMDSNLKKYDIKASNLYSILNTNYDIKDDYLTSPIIVQNN